MLAATNRVQFRGVPIEYGDTFIIVPPLTLAQVRDNAAMIDHVIKVTLKEEDILLAEQDEIMAEKLKLAHMAIQRNYPGITEADVADIVNIENIHQVTNAFFGASKVKKVKDLGEIEPVAPTSQT